MEVGKAKGIMTVAQMAGDTVLMDGVHGIGKSEVVREWAKEAGVHFEVLFLSQQEVGDLIGLPKVVEKGGKFLTDWTVPTWLQRVYEAAEAGKQSVIFLDELNRAPQDLKQSALQLVLDREIHQHKLPVVNGVKTLIVAAINPAGDEYHVDELDPALLDRFLKIDVSADPKSWLNWARANKVNGVVRDFIAENPTKLHFKAQNEDVGATPRSWTMLGKLVDNFKHVDPEMHFEVIKGKVGSAIGSQFYSFLCNYVNIMKVEDIEKFVKAKKKITKENIREVADELKNGKFGSLESVVQMELVAQMWEAYIKKATSQKDIMPLLVTLYALEIETLASVLKQYKAEDHDGYRVLAQHDFDKELFKTITKKIENTQA